MERAEHPLARHPVPRVRIERLEHPNAAPPGGVLADQSATSGVDAQFQEAHRLPEVPEEDRSEQRVHDGAPGLEGGTGVHGLKIGTGTSLV